jgi:hypothetical protein
MEEIAYYFGFLIGAFAVIYICSSILHKVALPNTRIGADLLAAILAIPVASYGFANGGPPQVGKALFLYGTAGLGLAALHYYSVPHASPEHESSMQVDGGPETEETIDGTGAAVATGSALPAEYQGAIRVCRSDECAAENVAGDYRCRICGRSLSGTIPFRRGA